MYVNNHRCPSFLTNPPFPSVVRVLSTAEISFKTDHSIDSFVLFKLEFKQVENKRLNFSVDTEAPTQV